MKIDVFPHILPRRFFDRMLEIAGGNLYMQKRMRAIPVLVDLEERFRIMDYFKMFYGDTALFGARHAMECGLAFFGAERVLFGTDMPFDPEKGPGFIRDTIGAMERMRATPAEKAKIYEGNARRMLRLRLKRDCGGTHEQEGGHRDHGRGVPR